jgi:hypothetical protein
MTNINDYKKRFYNLMESTMGDSKPLINEVFDSLTVNTNITTALQGVATFYNNSLNQYYTDNPNKKPNPVTTFSVKRTTGMRDSSGEEEVVWKPYFGNTELNVDGVRLRAIYDYQFKAVPTMKTFINTGLIDPIMNKMTKIDGVSRVNTTPSNTAVTAITNILKQVNSTRP